MKLPIDEEGLSKATCQWWGKFFLVDSHNGTLNLHRHFLKCLKWNEVKQDCEEQGRVLQNKITLEEFHEMLDEAIIKHNLPFNFVEYEGIRRVFSYLNLDVKHISKNTSKADVLKLYKWGIYLSYGTLCGWELGIEKHYHEFLSYATSTHGNSFIGENFKFLGRMGYLKENIFYYFR